MKRSLLFAAMSTALLTGCDDPQSHQPSRATPVDFTTELTPSNVDVVPGPAAGTQDQEAELKESLAQLKAADPTVKDMFYGVGENGERVVNIVHEQVSPEGVSSVTSSVWPLLGGLAVGALVGKMVSSGGVSNFAANHPPYRPTSHFSRDDDRTSRYNGNQGYRASPQVAQPRYNSGQYNQPRNDYQPKTRTSSIPTPPPQPAVAKRVVAPVTPSATVNSAPAKTSNYYSPTRATVQPYTPPSAQTNSPRTYGYTAPATAKKPQTSMNTRMKPAFKAPSPKPARSSGRSTSR